MSDINTNFAHTVITNVTAILTSEKDKGRIQLFGTDSEHSIAYETMKTSMSILQWLRVHVTGGLVEHKITIVTGEERKTQTILLNADSLAKHLGISHKQLSNLNEIEELKEKLKGLESWPQSPDAIKIRRELTKKQAQASILPQLLQTQVNLAKTLATAFDKEEDFFDRMRGFAHRIDPKDASSFFKAVGSLDNVEIKAGALGKGGFSIVSSQELVVTVGKKVHRVGVDLVLKTSKPVSDDKVATRTLQSFENEQRILRILLDRGADMTGIQELPHKVDKGLLMRRYDGDLCDVQVEKKHRKPMIKQLLTGLATLHRNGIIHGDIKPKNVLVKGLNTDNPQFRIIDFGGCKTKEEQKDLFSDVYEDVGNGVDLTKSTLVLKGAMTRKYDPDYTAQGLLKGGEYRSPELDALDKRDFGKWFEARQKADCYAMALSLGEKLEKPTPKEYKPILEGMRSGKLTAVEALEAFEKVLG